MKNWFFTIEEAANDVAELLAMTDDELGRLDAINGWGLEDGMPSYDPDRVGDRLADAHAGY